MKFRKKPVVIEAVQWTGEDECDAEQDCRARVVEAAKATDAARRQWDNAEIGDREFQIEYLKLSDAVDALLVAERKATRGDVERHQATASKVIADREEKRVSRR